MKDSNSELLPSKRSACEEVISRSHFAGNFDIDNETPSPEKDIYMIELESVDDQVKYLPFLPRGYGFSGGAARGALLGLLGEKTPNVRDLDIVMINDLVPDANVKEEIEQYQEYGANSRIGENTDLLEYFSTRDFTINEVFLTGNKLYFTRRAIVDTENKVIRPTDYEKEKGYLSSRILIRALLLEVEFIKLYRYGNHQDIESWRWQNLGNIGFNVALGLEKASQKQIEIEFLNKLFSLKIVDQKDIPEGLTEDGLRRLAQLTRHWMLKSGRNDFVFSDDYFNHDLEPNEIIDDEEEFKRYYDEIKRVVRTKHVSQDDLEY